MRKLGNAKTPTYALAILLLISMLATLFSATVIAVGEDMTRENTLIISSDWGAPVGYSPLLSRPSYFTNLMYPSLYINSPYSDEWIPYLAKNFTWLDKITLKVTLKDEAKWWNGQPITAEDVKYSFELGKNYSIPMYTPLWVYLEKVDVSPLSNKVVLFYVNQSTLNYFKALDILWQPLILPKARWETLLGGSSPIDAATFRDDNFDAIVGAGPYRVFDEDVANLLIYAVRVDDWWGKDIYGLPNPKYLVSRGFLNNDAANAAFTAGEVDVCSHMIPAIWEMFPTGVRTYYPDSPYFVAQGPVVLNINYKKGGALADPIVRKAIAYCCDLEAMVKGPYQNYSSPCIPVPIIHTGGSAVYINQTLINQYGWTFDLNKAKKLLDDNNIKDTNGDGYREYKGVELKGFTIQVPEGWTDWVQSCDIIAENMRSIGIGIVQENPVFQPTWWDRIASGTLDLFIGWSGWAPGYAHPWNSFLYFMDNRATNAFPSGNWMNYPDSGPGLIGSAEAIPLIDAIPSETDPAKVMQMYSRLQEIYLKDVVAVPLFYGAVWYEYQTTKWVGFPSAEYPWFSNIFGGTPGNTGWPSAMPMLFTVKPAGQTPAVPVWVNSMKFTTSQIYADLNVAPYRKADLNDDGQVNILDISIVAKAFASYPGHPRWDTRGDLNGDNNVNILDIAIIAKAFGKPV